jgi:hypothetical protein
LGSRISMSTKDRRLFRLTEMRSMWPTSMTSLRRSRI